MRRWRGTLRGVHKTSLAASQVLTTLNQLLMIRGTPRRHAAVQYAVFDPRTREMQIASAGMPGPLHLSAKVCRLLEIQGIPPGLFDPSVTYETLRITVEPGDSVLFGLSDAFDGEGESFGIERLQAICETEFHRQSTELLTRYFRQWTASLTAEPSLTTWRLPSFISAAINLFNLGASTPALAGATVFAHTASNLCCLSGDASFVHPASGVVH